MVIGKDYLIKRNNYFFLKYFFQLWKWWISSGGRAHGKKVFWGMVKYNTGYIYIMNFYNIWNIQGIVQMFFKTLKMNATSGIVFYPKIGTFTINLLAENQEPTSFLMHNTSTLNSNIRGNSIPMLWTEIGYTIFALQIKKFDKVRLVKAAGCYAKVIKKSFDGVYIQLPSSKIYIISRFASGTLGLSSKRNFRKMTKAGESRYIMKIPHVWGIAMNPVDHPHGGWSNKGCHPVTPAGILTKGIKTWNNWKWSKWKMYILKTKTL